MRPTDATSGLSPRRLAMEEARRSKRPSRGDRRAGVTPEPDRVLTDAGFGELLRRALAGARAAADLPSAVRTLMTLDGHLPAESAWRALGRNEAAAVRALTREGRVPAGGTGDENGIGGENVVNAAAAVDTVFTSALALNPHGKLVVTVPGRRQLPPGAAETGVAARVPWSPDDLAEYRRHAAGAAIEAARELAECRGLLTGLGERGRAQAVDALRAAVFLIPPVLFFHGDAVYSNLRDAPGNLTGKTLLPSHPDCFFHHLDKLPFELWTDEETVVVACLWLLHRSGGPNRLESSNGFQLSLRNVTDNLRAQALLYARTGRAAGLAERLAGEPAAATLSEVAAELGTARADLVQRRELYYEINATTRRKAENTFAAVPATDEAERFLCERLRPLLPGGAAHPETAGPPRRPAPQQPGPPRQFGPPDPAGHLDPAARLDPLALPGVLDLLRADRAWLGAPAGGWPTGFEALIHTTVVAARDLLGADFAMSRGIRSLPRLIEALTAHDYKEIVSWELPSFYCCVVPSAGALRLYGGDHAALADSAWAIAARMQYNTWHVMPGNLPADPAVTARDFLAPHALPDLAVHSGLHHRGHVANHIRFSARSPETVRVAGLPFTSLTDLRVVRCEGPEFTPRELYAVTRLARFVAQVSELVADTAAEGLGRVEVTSFDHRWYRETIIDGRMARNG